MNQLPPITSPSDDPVFRAQTPPILREARERAAIEGAPSSGPPLPPTIMMSFDFNKPRIRLRSIKNPIHPPLPLKPRPPNHGRCVLNTEPYSQIPYLRPVPRPIPKQNRHFLHQRQYAAENDVNSIHKKNSGLVALTVSSTQTADHFNHKGRAQNGHSRRSKPIITAEPQPSIIPSQYQPMDLTLPSSLSLNDLIEFLRRQQKRRLLSQSSNLTKDVMDNQQSNFSALTSDLFDPIPSTDLNDLPSQLIPSKSMPSSIAPDKGMDDMPLPLYPSIQPIQLSPERPYSTFNRSLSPSQIVSRKSKTNSAPLPLSCLLHIISEKQAADLGVQLVTHDQKDIVPHTSLETPLCFHPTNTSSVCFSTPSPSLLLTEEVYNDCETTSIEKVGNSVCHKKNNLSSGGDELVSQALNNPDMHDSEAAESSLAVDCSAGTNLSPLSQSIPIPDVADGLYTVRQSLCEKGLLQLSRHVEIDHKETIQHKKLDSISETVLSIRNDQSPTTPGSISSVSHTESPSILLPSKFTTHLQLDTLGSSCIDSEVCNECNDAHMESTPISAPNTPHGLAAEDTLPNDSLAMRVLSWPGLIVHHPLLIPNKSTLYNDNEQIIDHESFEKVEFGCLMDPSIPHPVACWHIWHLLQGKQAPKIAAAFWMAKASKLIEALEFINKEPKSTCNAPLLYLKAQILIYLERPEEAIQELDAIIDADRYIVDAWTLKGRCHQILGPSRLCINSYTHSICLEPNHKSWRTYFERGLVYEASGETIYAFKDFEMVRLLQPSFLNATWKHLEYYMDRALYDDALTTIDVILDSEPDNARALYLRSVIYSHLNLWVKALEDICTAIKLDPVQPEFYFHRGCLYRLTNAHRAIENLSIALLLDENFSDALMQRGYIYYTQTKYELAYADWSQALALNATPQLNMNLGLLAMRNLDDYILALHHLDLAMDMDPHLIEVYMARAELYQRLHQESFMVSGSMMRRLRKKKTSALKGEVNFLERAIRECSRAIWLHPSNYLLYLHRGRLLLRQKLKQLAMLDFQTSFLLNSSIAQTLLQRFLILSFQGRYSQVVDEFEDKKARGMEFEDCLLVLVAKAKLKMKDAKGALCILSSSGAGVRKPQLHVHRGICHQNLNEYAEAIHEYSIGISRSPYNAKAYYHRGVCHVLAGTTALGLKDIDQAIVLDPSLFDAYMIRASHCEKQGKYLDGIRDCTRAIQLEPGTIRGYLLRGLLHCRLRMFPDAISDFTTVTEIDPECIIAFVNRAITHHNAGDSGNAIKDYSIALLILSSKPKRQMLLQVNEKTNVDYLENCPDSKHHALLVIIYRFRGFLYWQLKEYHAAADDLAIAAAGSDPDAGLLELLGNSLLQTGQFKKAISIFSNMIILHPTSATGYFTRGTALAADNQHLAAVRDYARCIHLCPKYGDAYVSLGHLLLRNGQQRQALELFTAALSINPMCSDALQGRAFVYLHQGDAYAAILDISVVLQMNPKDAIAYVNRGVINESRGEMVDAMRDYKTALRISPNIAFAHFNAANLYYNQQYWEKAVQEYDQALLLMPNDCLTLVNRALTHAKMNAFDLAETDLVKASKSAGSPAENARVAYHRAELCEKMSKFTEAEVFLNFALAQLPDLVDVWIKRAEIRGLLGNMSGALQDYAQALSLDSTLELF